MELTRRDWFLALLVALVALGLVSIPYVLGYATTPRDLYYTGIVTNPEDSQSYFAKMLEGYEGNWLYTIPFTSEEHAPAFVGGFYLALGHVARTLGLPLDTMWHLARSAADLAMFLAAFAFIAVFLHEPRTRWTAYALALFGSGLGWILLLLKQTNWLDFFPVDFKMPESHLFFTALTFPHVALGTALILVSFGLTLHALDYSRWQDAAAAGFANLGLAIVYPYLIYLIIITIGMFWLYRVILTFPLTRTGLKRGLRDGLIISLEFLVPAPLLLHYAFTLATNPVFRAWEAQSVTPSPPAAHYLVAYGAMLLLGLPMLWRKRSEFAFLGCWLVAVALLVYAPLNAQRRFVEGVQVPLAILASAGLVYCLVPWLEQTRVFRWLTAHPRYSAEGLQRLTLVSILLLMSLSNLYILFSTSITASLQPVYPLFRLRSEIDAVDWLHANTARSDVVLGAYETGNLIAARAGNRVVLGHWAETVNWRQKFDEVSRFYASGEDGFRRDLLARYRVAYLLEGPQERALGEFDPSRVDYLKSVYSNSVVQVFAVQMK